MIDTAQVARESRKKRDRDIMDDQEEDEEITKSIINTSPCKRQKLSIDDSRKIPVIAATTTTS